MKKTMKIAIAMIMATLMLASCGAAAVGGVATANGALISKSLSLTEIIPTDVPEQSEGDGAETDADVETEVETEGETEEDVDTEEDVIVIPENVVMEGIAVTDEKHTYNGSDLVILTVKNTLTENYSLTATVTYYDVDGNAIKTEAQTFDQYSAGYQNYFLFIPEITFAYYSYTITGVLYEGVCYAENFTGGFSHFEIGMGNAQGADAVPGKNMRQFVVHGAMQLINKNDVEVIFSGYIVLFNNKGEIKSILYRSPHHMAPNPEGVVNGYSHWLVNKEVKETSDYYTYDEEGNLISITHSNDYLTFPEELEGELRSFLVVSSITAWDGQ